MALVHVLGIIPVLFILVNRAAKGKAHHSGWNFNSSGMTASGPGAFSDLSCEIEVIMSSGDTGGHSGCSPMSISREVGKFAPLLPKRFIRVPNLGENCCCWMGFPLQVPGD